MKNYILSCMCALSCVSIYSIPELTSNAALTNALQTNDLVVLDLFMTHCGPCKIMGPLLDQLAAQIPAVTFLKVNITSVDGLTSRYNVRGVPCLIFFKNGVEVGRHVGCGSNTTVASLRQEIRSVFGL